MILRISYLQKLYIISFFLYGGVFSLLMWAINYDSMSFYNFLFYFITYGALMSFTMVGLEKLSLKKEGIKAFDKDTMDPLQKRVVPVPLTKEEFYDFWNNSEEYKISKNKDGSINIHKRLYTTEFNEKINVSYTEGITPAMVFVSKPKWLLHNNLALIHRTINRVENYVTARI